MSKIQINGLNLHYGSFHALKDVDLTIHPNEITAFIGPSGCGKSTLLKTLNRMNDLVEGCRIDGKVLLDGVDIYRDMDTALLRKRVGMVFQKANPFPMSIYDNIAFGPRTHGIRSKAKLDDIIERTLTAATRTSSSAGMKRFPITPNLSNPRWIVPAAWSTATRTVPACWSGPWAMSAPTVLPLRSL